MPCTLCQSTTLYRRYGAWGLAAELLPRVVDWERLARSVVGRSASVWQRPAGTASSNEKLLSRVASGAVWRSCLRTWQHLGSERAAQGGVDSATREAML